MALALGTRPRRAVEALWFAGCCHVAGIRIRLWGEPPQHVPTLFVCNHVSYLDVPVLGFLCEGIFVAKSEVARWPFIGPVARLARTVFVDRNPVSVAAQVATLRSRLAAGTSLFLFPEGTSSNGDRVLPFKSSLFDAASPVAGAARPILVQPVALTYTTTACGRALTGGIEDCYAWHGDMDLLPHLWRVLGLAGVEVEVTFLEAVPSDGFTGRKGLARYCHGQVALGVEANRARGAFHRTRRPASASLAPPFATIFRGLERVKGIEPSS